MKQVNWVYIKKLAVENNLVSKLKYVLSDKLYTVYLSLASETYYTRFKQGTDNANDFETNYKPKIISDIDDAGKQYVTLYSGNQSNETVCYTTVGDTTDTIGNGTSTVFDASLDVDSGGASFDTDTSKTTYIQFNDSFRILKGAIFWTGGELDVYGDCYVVATEGAPIGVDEDGNPILAPYEIPVSHFVLEQRLMSSTYTQLEFQSERSTDLIPSYYLIKIVWTKPAANNTLKGFIRFDIYRGGSV